MEAQREAVSRYVQNRGQIIAEFIEVESGRKDNRPQLRAAIEECRKRKAVLLIARLDRLARNVAFIANLMNSDVEFLAVDMPQANRLTIHILAAVAEHEREMISQRTKAALAAAKAKGIKLGNPRWKESIDRARDARGYAPATERVISLIAEWREHGCTYRKIAAALNELHNRTPQGKQWYSSTVRTALLRNRPRAQTSLLKEARAGANPCFIQPEGVPMPSDIREAQRLIDVFTSAGARQFVVTKLDVEQAIKWGKAYSAGELRNLLPAMVRTAEFRRKHTLASGQEIEAGENLIVRPSGPDVIFVQLDDLTVDQLKPLYPASCLMINTSPGNYQAWMAVSGVDKSESKDFVRRVHKAVGDADKSASGSTRVSGTENWKLKYLPEPPLVTITHAAPGRVMTPERLHAMGLLAKAEQTPHIVKPAPQRVSPDFYERPWPSYQVTLSRTRPRRDGTGSDRSLADFNWSLTALTGQKSIEDTIAKLLEVSPNAQERAARGDTGYACITVENAAAAVARNWGRNRA
jgi:DNA invertase Pin-like site-specific DNA recombinase